MLTNIIAAVFTVVLIGLILKLLLLAFKLSWGIVKAILLVAVMPCFLGGIFILGLWYVALPAAVELFLLAYLSKIK